jgi:hypothetical protein
MVLNDHNYVLAGGKRAVLTIVAVGNHNRDAGLVRKSYVHSEDLDKRSIRDSPTAVIA